MKVYCVVLLESPHRDDSKEFTQYLYTIFNMKKRKLPFIITNLQLRDFSKGLENKFETVVVNESSVFEPLMFYLDWPQSFCLN